MKITTKEITKCAILISILIASSVTSINLFSQIPFTLQTLIIMIIACVLTPKLYFFSITCYIFIGVIGFPVFSGFKSGLGTLFGATGGFIFGFLFGGLIISFLFGFFYRKPNKLKNITELKINNESKIFQKLFWLFTLESTKIFICIFIGNLFIYIFGLLQFTLVTNSNIAIAFNLTILPFIFFDFIKIILAVVIVKYLRKFKIIC